MAVFITAHRPRTAAIADRSWNTDRSLVSSASVLYLPIPDPSSDAVSCARNIARLTRSAYAYRCETIILYELRRVIKLLSFFVLTLPRTIWYVANRWTMSIPARHPLSDSTLILPFVLFLSFLLLLSVSSDYLTSRVRSTSEFNFSFLSTRRAKPREYCSSLFILSLLLLRLLLFFLRHPRRDSGLLFATRHWYAKIVKTSSP